MTQDRSDVETLLKIINGAESDVYKVHSIRISLELYKLFNTADSDMFRMDYVQTKRGSFVRIIADHNIDDVDFIIEGEVTWLLPKKEDE